MAKTGNVVNVAALRGIGRARFDDKKNQQKNKNNNLLTNVLKIGGNLAVRLFFNANNQTQLLRNNYRQGVDQLSEDLKDVKNDGVLGDLLQNELNELQEQGFSLASEQTGRFGPAFINEEKKQATSKKITDFNNKQINLKNSTKSYLDYHKRYSAILRESTVEIGGQNVKVSFKGAKTQNSAEDIFFASVMANRKLDQFLIYDENKNLGLPKGVIAYISMSGALSDGILDETEIEELKDLQSGTKKLFEVREEKQTDDPVLDVKSGIASTSSFETYYAENFNEFVPINKWPQPKADLVQFGDEFTRQQISLGIQNSKIKLTEEQKSLYKQDASTFANSMAPNAWSGWLFAGTGFPNQDGSPASVSDGPIDSWIMNPTFDVNLQVQKKGEMRGDVDSTDTVTFNKTYVDEQMAKFDKLEDEKQRAVDIAAWKQGVREQLKINNNFINDPRLKDWAAGEWANVASNSQESFYEDPNKGGPQFTPTAVERNSKAASKNISNIIRKEQITFDDIQFMLRGASSDLALELSEDGKSVQLMQTKIYQDGVRVAPLGAAELSNKKALEKLLWEYTGTLDIDRKSIIK